MLEENYKKLIMDFLFRNYPIIRVKYDHRFKRAIIINDRPLFLSEGKNVDVIKNSLTSLIIEIFAEPNRVASKIIDEFMA